MNDAELKARVARSLDARAAGIADADLARLRQARSRAVDSAGAVPSWQRRGLPWRVSERPFLLATTASIVLAVAAIGMWSIFERAPGEIGPFSEEVMVVIELESAAVELDLIENLDFFDWLELVEPDGGAA